MAADEVASSRRPTSICAPASCSGSIALEDSPTGAAALGAGMFVIGIPSYPGVQLEEPTSSASPHTRVREALQSQRDRQSLLGALTASASQDTQTITVVSSSRRVDALGERLDQVAAPVMAYFEDEHLERHGQGREVHRDAVISRPRPTRTTARRAGGAEMRDALALNESSNVTAIQSVSTLGGSGGRAAVSRASTCPGRAGRRTGRILIGEPHRLVGRRPRGGRAAPLKGKGNRALRSGPPISDRRRDTSSRSWGTRQLVSEPCRW